MKVYFTLDQNNNHIGPFDLEDLKRNNLKPSDFVWKEGMADWKKASEVEELRELFPLPTVANTKQSSGEQYQKQTHYQQSSSQNSYQQNYHQQQQGYYNWDVYAENFDINQLTPEMKEFSKNHRIDEEFPVVAAVLLHVFTFGLFSIIYYGIKHDQFPRLKEDDFGAGKAIGFMFIPFFNLYWLFMFFGRLTDRVNFQFKLNGQVPPVNKNTVITYCIMRVCYIIPLLGYLTMIAGLVLAIINVAKIQESLNKIARQRKSELGQFNYQS